MESNMPSDREILTTRSANDSNQLKQRKRAKYGIPEPELPVPHLVQSIPSGRRFLFAKFSLSRSNNWVISYQLVSLSFWFFSLLLDTLMRIFLWLDTLKDVYALMLTSKQFLQLFRNYKTISTWKVKIIIHIYIQIHVLIQMETRVERNPYKRNSTFLWCSVLLPHSISWERVSYRNYRLPILNWLVLSCYYSLKLLLIL